MTHDHGSVIHYAQFNIFNLFEHHSSPVYPNISEEDSSYSVKPIYKLLKKMKFHSFVVKHKNTIYLKRN